ncbi:hypothetical protein H7H78_01985 [Mycobacterium shinjukuense]|uniref:Uncharacterized protein n=1 Tax=Mycobacterium shinjukuense TaxID=398694 RepID=A0A7I7MPM6_9MYCO|nr:hypothetical protein [Mycobacterium shinjukuense]MCV6984262.1 hypothetical protein [Mycobacterium shinjukuense]ORB65872.1 hypothetical protein BST45_14595 [Mycobacterium shinjukuense]BBX74221.1 hypothetical protein MSHI_21270 [Mycobacterium shinjukuense]
MAKVLALIDDAHVLPNNDSPRGARSLPILAEEELACAKVLYDTAVHAWQGNAETVELMKASGTAGSDDSVQAPHTMVLPHAHPNPWAEFTEQLNRPNDEDG